MASFRYRAVTPAGETVEGRMDAASAEAARAEALAIPLDVLVVAAYGLILPEAVLAWPRHGCLNIHASKLPRWRGAAPIVRAIEAGDATTGITIMQMDAGLDTGPMLAQRALPIGARTTESQVHRELASGLSAPVGFKNGTDGNIKIAIDAIQAAARPHHFLSVHKNGQVAIVETRGNKDCHVILRGGKAPNYDAASVAAACKDLEAAKLRCRLMIDASHANSSKQHQRQVVVAQDVAGQVAAGDARIVGLMIESHLEEGRQDIVPGAPLKHGVSVTDACISMEQTIPVLQQLAAAVKARRAR